MSLSFYLDHHVPVAIAVGLRQRQIDVLTAQEDGRADWDDDRLLERAFELVRVVFTQDRDFLVLAADWQRQLETLPEWSTVTSCESPSGVRSTIWHSLPR